MNELLIRVLAICLVTAVLCVMLKSKNGEAALLTAVAAGVVISLMLIKAVTPVIAELKALLKDYSITTEYFAVALKAVGIGYLTSFIADSCRDCGQNSLAAKAELAGKCVIFMLSLPLLISVLKTALGFIK